MGRIRHDTIVVTGAFREDADFAQKEAVRLGLCASAVVPGTTNGYASFFIAPDGSKEGWEESDSHDRLREEFVAFLRSKSDVVRDKYDDRLRPLWCDWVYLTFGGDDDDVVVRDHKDQ